MIIKFAIMMGLCIVYNMNIINGSIYKKECFFTGGVIRLFFVYVWEM